jgi:hypothetical protein
VADRLGLKLTPLELESNNWVTDEFELALPN